MSAVSPASLLASQAPSNDAVLLHLKPVVELDRAQFYAFCQLNRERRLERTANGELIIMAPASGSSGSGNSHLITALSNWAAANGQGTVFDSSTGFDLPNGAMRSP